MAEIEIDLDKVIVFEVGDYVEWEDYSGGVPDDPTYLHGRLVAYSAKHGVCAIAESDTGMIFWVALDQLNPRNMPKGYTQDGKVIEYGE